MASCLALNKRAASFRGMDVLPPAAERRGGQRNGSGSERADSINVTVIIAILTRFCNRNHKIRRWRGGSVSEHFGSRGMRWGLRPGRYRRGARERERLPETGEVSGAPIAAGRRFNRWRADGALLRILHLRADFFLCGAWGRACRAGCGPGHPGIGGGGAD